MDYTYPSIFFSYFLFFLYLFGGIYFCIRSARRGYWGEEAKYHVFDDQSAPKTPVATAPKGAS